MPAEPTEADLVELAPVAIFVRAVETGAISFWNRAAEKLYGWPRAEAVGRVSHELLHTEFPRPLADIEAELEQRGGWEGELVQTTRDGHRVLVKSRWAVRCDRDGRPLGYVEASTDITEQTRLLQQAEAAEA